MSEDRTQLPNETEHVDQVVTDIVDAVSELHKKLEELEEWRKPVIQEIQERVKQHKIEKIYNSLKQ